MTSRNRISVAVLVAFLAAACGRGAADGPDPCLTVEPARPSALVIDGDLPSEAARSGPDLDLMSFNIRYDNRKDDPNWDARLPPILEMLRTRQPDVIGIQEGESHQVADLAGGLAGYECVGVGRDGGMAGEFAAIFYRTDTFAAVDNGTFWLSETPEVPSVGWDAGLKRIATWAELQRIGSDETFFVFNTHFDHTGRVALAESAQLLATRVDATGPRRPAFVMGDLNAEFENEALAPLTTAMSSARRTAPMTDDIGSYNGNRTPEGEWKIDFILFDTADPISFETVDDDYGIPFISDHYPIVATLRCEACG